jgi:hypothetical protein
MKDVGKLMMVIGCLLLLVGFVVWFGEDKLKWFGHLPGDIHIRKPGMSFFMPVTSMILVSIGLSLIIWLIRRFV